MYHYLLSSVDSNCIIYLLSLVDSNCFIHLPSAVNNNCIIHLLSSVDINCIFHLLSTVDTVTCSLNLIYFIISKMIKIFFLNIRFNLNTLNIISKN